MRDAEGGYRSGGGRKRRRPEHGRCALEVTHASGSTCTVTLGFRVVGGERDGHEFWEVFDRLRRGDPYQRFPLTEEVAAGTKLHGVAEACLAGTAWEGAFAADDEPFVLDGEALKAMEGGRFEAKVARSVHGYEYVRHRTVRPLPRAEGDGSQADAERDGFVGEVLRDLAGLEVGEEGGSA